MKKLVATAIVIAGLAAAGFLADQAIERDHDYDRLIDLGDDALSRDQTFVAIEHYSGAIALKRGSMLAYLKRGEAHQRRGDTPEMLSSALRDLRTAAALDPGSTRTLERLGDVNFQLRRYANAAESYEGYIRLDDHSPEIFYKLALAARGDGRLARATTALQQAVKLNPNFHEAHYVLGLCLRDRGQLSEARAAFDRAITISPAFIPAREELADLYRLEDSDREEIEQLEALFALDPAKAERLIAVGLAHLRAGNRDLAVVTLGRAAELFPDMPNVYAALGQVWLEAAEDWGDPTDLRKALEAFERVITQTNASSETLGQYGRALVLAGEHARAEACCARRRSDSRPILRCCPISRRSPSGLDILTTHVRRSSGIQFSWMRIATRLPTRGISGICRCNSTTRCRPSPGTRNQSRLGLVTRLPSSGLPRPRPRRDIWTRRGPPWIARWNRTRRTPPRVASPSAFSRDSAVIL